MVKTLYDWWRVLTGRYWADLFDEAFVEECKKAVYTGKFD